MITRRTFLQSSAAAAALAASAGSARADNAPGITDTEIKIGNTMPYSGPASAYGVIGRTETAYFKMINEQGGVNGRKINSSVSTTPIVRRRRSSRCAAWSRTRRWRSCSRRSAPAPNLAIRQYLNDNKVPQLFVSTGASVFSDPEHFPWTIGFNPNYQTEAHIYAKDILATKPDGKIAVLYQNDGFGKDYLNGLKDVLGADHAGMIVKEASYETSEPTVDSQIVTLAGLRRGHSGHRRDAEIRRPGDPQILRSRLERDPLSQQRLALDRHRAEARRPRQVEGAHHQRLRQGSDRRDARRTIPGIKEWRAFCDKYMSQKEFIDVNATYAFGAARDDDSGAQAVRGRSFARERHEAGRQHQGSRSCRCC